MNNKYGAKALFKDLAQQSLGGLCSIFLLFNFRSLATMEKLTHSKNLLYFLGIGNIL